jgi:flagellar hook-length control protein FliK
MKPAAKPVEIPTAAPPPDQAPLHEAAPEYSRPATPRSRPVIDAVRPQAAAPERAVQSEPGRAPVTVPTPSAAPVTAATRTTETKNVVATRLEALAHVIASRAGSMPQSGSIHLRFALTPPELGTVRVRLEARGEQLRVELVANNQAAVEALNAGLTKLATHLQNVGFQDAEVTLGLASSSHSGTTAEGSRGDAGSRAANNDSTESSREENEEQQPDPQRMTNRNRLDMLA